MIIHQTTPPSLSIETLADTPPVRSLQGWDDLNRWGMFNHPQWRSLQNYLDYMSGVNEIDKLRLLAGEMLRANVALMEKHLEFVRAAPIPPIFIPSSSVEPKPHP